MDLSQEDPIPLFVEGQTLLTEEVLIGHGVTETRHFRPSNLHAWKLYWPSWGPRAIPGKLLTWCQGPFVTHHSRCMNHIGRDLCPSVGRKDGTCFESEAIISIPIWCACSETDFSQWRFFTSHVCGFCVTSLGLRSGSRSTHQATHQSFPVGTSGATQNNAQVGPSSCVFIFIETAIRIRMWYSREILWWRHSLKMADHENCVSVSIGFSETALIPSRIECRSWQVCVREREHPTSTRGIPVAGTWVPCKESTTVTGSGVDLCSRDSPPELVRSGEDAVPCQTVKALPTRLGKNPGGC